MDIVRFIEERNRMCKSFNYGCGCQMCPACDNDLHCVLSVMSTLDTKEQIAIVEKWSAEHPKKKKKTRQDVFLEHYPDTQIDDNGLLSMCPAVISPLYRGDRGGCLSIPKCCVDCRREFWMQEIGEDE